MSKAKVEKIMNT